MLSRRPARPVNRQGPFWRAVSRHAVGACDRCGLRILSALVFAAVLAATRLRHLQLGAPARVSGWALLACVAILWLFHFRKMVPAGRLGDARGWMRVHLTVGWLSLAIFALHARLGWPEGGFERLLLLLFLGAGLSGVVGWALSRWTPGRLRRAGLEPIHEHITHLCQRLLERMDEIVMATPELSAHYDESLRAYLGRPTWRSPPASLGVFRQVAPERASRILDDKAALDRHHRWQGVLKLWLLVHIPCSVLLVIGAAMHVLLVLGFSGGR